MRAASTASRPYESASIELRLDTDDEVPLLPNEDGVLRVDDV